MYQKNGWFESQINEIKLKFDEHFHYSQYISELEEIKNRVNVYDPNSPIDTYVNLPDYKIHSKLSVKLSRFIDFSFLGKYRDTWFSWCRVIFYIIIFIFHISNIIKFLNVHTIVVGSNTITNSNGGGVNH